MSATCCPPIPCCAVPLSGAPLARANSGWRSRPIRIGVWCCPGIIPPCVKDQPDVTACNHPNTASWRSSLSTAFTQGEHSPVSSRLNTTSCVPHHVPQSGATMIAGTSWPVSIHFLLPKLIFTMRPKTLAARAAPSLARLLRLPLALPPSRAEVGKAPNALSDSEARRLAAPANILQHRPMTRRKVIRVICVKTDRSMAVMRSLWHSLGPGRATAMLQQLLSRAAWPQ